MEAELVPSLSPLLQGADQWGEVLLLLPLLVTLEAVLSADNAIALAAISKRLHDPDRQRQALNLGLLLALVFRMALIVAARWVLHAWPLQLAAAAYLLWLSGRHLLGLDTDAESPEAAVAEATPAQPGSVAATHGHAAPSHHAPSLASIALTLAFTDLAFSLDSVAAAVAVTDRLALVMAGGLLGVLALRLTAGLFVRWLELFSRLETAGYLAVGLVGIRLLLRLLLPELEIPEWGLLLLVTSLFLWGFSSRTDASVPPGDREALVGPVAAPSAGTPGTQAPETIVAEAPGLPAGPRPISIEADAAESTLSSTVPHLDQALPESPRS